MMNSQSLVAMKSVLEESLKPLDVPLDRKMTIVLVAATDLNEFSREMLIPKLNRMYESAKAKVNCEFVYVGCDNPDTMPVEFIKIPDENRALKAVVDLYIHSESLVDRPLCMLLNYHPSLLQIAHPDATDLIMKDSDDAKSFPYEELKVNLWHALAAGCCVS